MLANISDTDNCSFTIPANATGILIRVLLNAGVIYDVTIHLRYSENYKAYSVLWSDHGTVYKGTAKYKGDGEWEITPTYAEADLGSFDYNQAATSATGAYRFQTAQNAIPAVFPPNDTTVADIISSNYKAITAAQTATPVVGVALSFGTRIIIYDESLKTATAADFKTAMSGVKLVYKLASPTSFTVTGPDPETLLGDNNIWSDTGDISVKYRANTALYIEKKLGE